MQRFLLLLIALGGSIVAYAAPEARLAATDFRSKAALNRQHATTTMIHAKNHQNWDLVEGHQGSASHSWLTEYDLKNTSNGKAFQAGNLSAQLGNLSV